ncbi:HEAT repeat domain-containing protein [Halomontanus rarus]|uniref:HEAT repeat domain-containing protein n=1 Tax=Halomontanus rarus TaxID=3034020 RepID=UPI001A99F467
MTTEDGIDRATALREAARTEPETIDVDDVVDLLVRGDRETRRTAFDAYETLRTVRPAAVDSAVARLERLLVDDDADVRRRAALTTGALVETDPDSFARLVPELRTVGADSTEPGREPAIAALSKLAFERPTAVVPAVDTLLEICDESVTLPDDPSIERGVPAVESDSEASLKQERELRDQLRVHAIAALTLVAAEDAAALRGSVSSVSDLLEDDHTHVRAAACEVLEAVAIEFPGDVVPFAPELAERAVSDGKHPVPWRAADALVALEVEFPEKVGDAVAPVVGGLSRFLDSKDADRRRIGATLAVDAAVAQPETIEPVVPTLRELLADDDATVRTKAALALGFADVGSARPALAELAETDPDEPVRNAADRALERLERTEDDAE